MNIHFAMFVDGGARRDESLDLVLDGSPDEMFYDVVDRAYRTIRKRSIKKQHGKRRPALYFHWVDDAIDPDDGFLIYVERELTLREIDRFFGEEGRQNPPHVLVDTGSGSGGDSFVPEMVEMLSNALTAYGVLEIYLQGRRAGFKVKHRKSREAINEWEDSGVISSALEQLVRAEFIWDQRAFERQFGVTRAEGGRLLRALGYSKKQTYDGDSYWSPYNEEE